MTFSGGQFFAGVFDVVVPAVADDDGSVSLAAAGVEPDPPVASQPGVVGFFLRVRFLAVDVELPVCCPAVELGLLGDCGLALPWFAGAAEGVALCD